jgi:hypothetical protein
MPPRARLDALGCVPLAVHADLAAGCRLLLGALSSPALDSAFRPYGGHHHDRRVFSAADVADSFETQRLSAFERPTCSAWRICCCRATLMFATPSPAATARGASDNVRTGADRETHKTADRRSLALPLPNGRSHAIRAPGAIA